MTISSHTPISVDSMPYARSSCVSEYAAAGLRFPFKPDRKQISTMQPRERTNKKSPVPGFHRVQGIDLATSYSPTGSPLQYHWR